MSKHQLFKQTLQKIRKDSGDDWATMSAKVGYSRSYLAQMGEGARTITADVCWSLAQQYQLAMTQRCDLMECCDLVNLRCIEADPEAVDLIRKVVALAPALDSVLVANLHDLLSTFADANDI